MTVLLWVGIALAALAALAIGLRAAGAARWAEMIRTHNTPLESGSVEDTVGTGSWLGAVGDSGNTGEPHLHVHAQRPGPAGAPIGGDPLPITFNGRFPVRGDRIGSP